MVSLGPAVRYDNYRIKCLARVYIDATNSALLASNAAIWDSSSSNSSVAATILIAASRSTTNSSLVSFTKLEQTIANRQSRYRLDLVAHRPCRPQIRRYLRKTFLEVPKYLPWVFSFRPRSRHLLCLFRYFYLRVQCPLNGSRAYLEIPPFSTQVQPPPQQRRPRPFVLYSYGRSFCRPSSRSNRLS